MTGLQIDSLAVVGSVEVLPEGWLRVPGSADGADLVHGSGLAIYDLGKPVVLVGPKFSLELASMGDALATASALLGRS